MARSRGLEGCLIVYGARQIVPNAGWGFVECIGKGEKRLREVGRLSFSRIEFLKFFMNILHSKIRVFEDILFWNYVTMCPPIFSRKFSTIGKIGKIWRNTIGIHVCVCVIYESRYSRSFTSPWSKVFTAQTDIFVYSLFLYSTFQFHDFSHTLNGKLNSPLISPVHKFCYNLITDHPIFFPSNLHLINYLLKAIS